MKSGPIKEDWDMIEIAIRTLFALHLTMAAQIEPEVGVMVYDAALEEGVDPYDVAAVMISEESGPDWDFSLVTAARRRTAGIYLGYEYDEVGQMGEMGYFQVAPRWGKLWAKERGLEPDTVDLHDEKTNIQVGAFVWRKALESHAKHAVDEKDIEDCKRRKSRARRHIASGAPEELWPMPTCRDIPDHHPIVHYKCKPESRNDMCGQCARAQLKWTQLRESLTMIKSDRNTEVRKKTRERRAFCSAES
jgi:hypothetical protein